MALSLSPGTFGPAVQSGQWCVLPAKDKTRQLNTMNDKTRQDIALRCRRGFDMKSSHRRLPRHAMDGFQSDRVSAICVLCETGRLAENQAATMYRCEKPPFFEPLLHQKKAMLLPRQARD